MPAQNISYKPQSSDAMMTNRRRLIQIAGVTLVGTTLVGVTGCTAAMAAAAPAFPRVETGPIRPTSVAGVPVGTLDGGTKPIFVAPPGNLDPVVHSVADTLFWGEQLMEHAMFFAMMMPGPELAAPRGEAERFQQQFANHLAKLRGSRLDRSNYVAFNNSTLSPTHSSNISNAWKPHR
jgi:hypothetical protein